MCYTQTYFGLGIGTSVNQLIQSHNNNISFEYARGLIACFVLSHQLNKELALVFESGFIQKGYVKKSIHNKKSIREAIMNDYLQFSPNFRLTSIQIRKKSIFIEVGTYISYWLNSKTIAQYPNILSVQVRDDNQFYSPIVKVKLKNKFNGIRDNRFDIGINTAVGNIIKLKNSIVEFKIIYSQSLKDQQKKQPQMAYRQGAKINQSFNFLLSYSFKI